MTSRRLGFWSALIGRRLLQALAVALIVGAMTFVMMQSLPGDMAMRIAAGRYGYDLVGGAAADAVAAELGLDRPIYQQFFAWMGDLMRLDLGVSSVTGESIWREVSHQLGATMQLAAAALVFGALIGIPLGIVAGLRAGGWIDRATLGAAAILRATPHFLLALILILLVSVQTGVLPVAGDDHVFGVILPGLTLGLGLAAGLARVVRHAIHDAARAPSFEFARTKGLTDTQALVRHGLRNAALPVVSWLGVQTVFIVEGALIVETLFAWPGIGHALVHAVFGRDVPMIQGTALVMGLLFVTFNMLVDAACAALDPRRRGGAA